MLLKEGLLYTALEHEFTMQLLTYNIIFRFILVHILIAVPHILQLISPKEILHGRFFKYNLKKNTSYPYVIIPFCWCLHLSLCRLFSHCGRRLRLSAETAGHRLSDSSSSSGTSGVWLELGVEQRMCHRQHRITGAHSFTPDTASIFMAMDSILGQTLAAACTPHFTDKGRLLQKR